MANTLYAAFTDTVMAEKAAGALLDHGVRAEDLSLVQHESRYNLPSTVAEDTGVSPDVPAPNMTGELTGATTSSPGVIGTGTYTPPGNMTETTPPMTNTGPYGDTAEVLEESNSTDEDFGVVRNQEEYDRETAYTTFSGYNNDNVKEDEKDEQPDTYKMEKAAKQGISTTTGADAGAAAITGGAVGLGVGAVAALASLLIPGFGLIVGGGALATAIGGLVATTGAGAAVGAVTGYLKDQGVDHDVAQKYGETVSGGGAILAVNIPSGDVDEPKARDILAKYGAVDVNSYALSQTTKPYMA